MARKGIAPLDIQKEAVDQATQNLAEYGDRARRITEVETRLNDAVKKLQDEAEEELKPLREEREDLKRALQVFANSYRRKLAVGKTITLPTGKLSWKDGKPSIEVTDVKLALKSLQRLKRLGRIQKLSDFIKTSHSIKKDPLKRKPDIARQVEGVTLHQGEELFYIDPVEIEADTSATGKNGTGVEIAID